MSLQRLEAANKGLPRLPGGSQQSPTFPPVVVNGVIVGVVPLLTAFRKIEILVESYNRYRVLIFGVGNSSPLIRRGEGGMG